MDHRKLNKDLFRFFGKADLRLNQIKSIGIFI